MTTSTSRIAFWGTPELTTAYLNALKAANMLPVVVVTNPDRPQGRHQVLTPTPAKAWALAHDIPVLQPEKIDDAFRAAFTAYNIDLSIVVAYGSIIPKDVIDIPTHKTINVHYSLLPKYRGAAPTEAAILAGDTETGVSIQLMRPKLDTGPVVAHANVYIGADETTPELRARLTETGAALLTWTLPDLFAGKLDPIEQDESHATHCGKIKKEDAEIHFTDDAETNYRKYRAYKEWPRTYFFHEHNGVRMRVIIIEAKMEGGVFEITRVLPEGKKEIAYEEFVRNY